MNKQNTGEQKFRTMYACQRCKRQFPVKTIHGQRQYFECIICGSYVCPECVGLREADQKEGDMTCICRQCVDDGY